MGCRQANARSTYAAAKAQPTCVGACAARSPPLLPPADGTPLTCAPALTAGKYLARQTCVLRGVVPMLAAPMSEGSGGLAAPLGSAPGAFGTG